MLDRQRAADQRRPRTADSSAAAAGSPAVAGTGSATIESAAADRSSERGATAPEPVDRSSGDAAIPADLGRVRAVIEALPEAVFVTEPDGDLRLTNPAADRLFEGHPVQDRSDLLGRFEEIGAKSDPVRSIPMPSDAERARTVRPRDQPNRWFTLRTIPLDPGGNEL